MVIKAEDVFDINGEFNSNYPKTAGTYFSGGGGLIFHCAGLCNIYADAVEWRRIQWPKNPQSCFCKYDDGKPV